MQPPRILILDADAVVRAELSQVFADLGWTVRQSSSASKGLAMLEDGTVGCAVVDVELEDMPGLEAIPLLCQVSPELRIVVTAKENRRDLEAQIRQHGVVYYYVKSFDREELVQAVACAMGGRYMTEKPRILVVDDDPDYQAAVRQILESGGYEVRSTYSKEEGLAALKEVNPDLVILDIMMRKATDGFFFLYELQEKQGSERPPVLSVSVISQETGMDFSPTTDGDYFPADDFLRKPVDPKDLLDHVGALLAGHRPSKQDG